MKNTNSLFYSLLIFLLTLPATGFAQLAIGPSFAGGIASVQAQDVNLPTIPGAIFSWEAGFMVQKNFSDKWAAQPELSYFRKGYEAAEQQPAFGRFIADGDIITNYLELNLNAKYFLSNKQDVAWYVMGGPYVGYILNGSFQGEEGLVGLSSPFKEDLTFGENGISRFDMGVNIGLGGQFDLGRPWFFIEFRYSQGLANTNNVGDGSIRNYTFMGQFGWLIYLEGDR